MATSVLELKISDNAEKAAQGLAKLSEMMNKLKQSATGSMGLSKVAKQVGQLGTAVDAGLSDTALAKLERLANVLQKLKSLNGVRLPRVPKSAASTEGGTPAIRQVSGQSGGMQDAIPNLTQVTTGAGRAQSRLQSLTTIGQRLSPVVQRLGARFRTLVASMRETRKGAIGLGNNFLRVALYRGIDLALQAVIDGFKEGVKNLYAYSSAVNGTFAKSMDAMSSKFLQAKNTVATVFAPALNALVPILQKIANAAIFVMNVIAQLIALLSGSTVWTEATEAVTSYGEAVGGAAGKQKNLLAGFDQINLITSKSGGGGGGVLGDTGSMFQQSEVAGWMQDNLANIQMMLGGAELALGALLTFSGHPVIGIALMALGAKTMVDGAILNWNFAQDKVGATLTAIEVLLGAGLMAVGAVLAFSGANVPLGIGLLVTGLATAGSAIATNWDGLPDNVASTLNNIKVILNGAELALGAVLAFSGINIPLGIALMAVGAIGLVRSGKLAWDALDGDVASSVEKIQKIVGGALLGIGAVLAFSGVGIPIGLALMAVGALALAPPAVLNWKTLVENVTNPFNDITSAVSTGLLAIGAILALSGINIPLGVALIAAGIVTMPASASAETLDWNGFKNTVISTFGAIDEKVAIGMLGLGAILALTGVNMPLGIALMAAGGVALATSTEVDWTALTSKVASAFTSMISGIKNAFDNVTAKIDSWFNKPLNKQVQTTVHTSSSGVTHGGGGGSIDAMASGGFPSVGQMFIARESGPEMVGRIGNRTAVANNQQIVEGVAQGVADANADQNRLLAEQNNLLRQILAKTGDGAPSANFGRMASQSIAMYERTAGIG